MEPTLVWNTAGNFAKSFFIGMTQLALALFICRTHSPDHEKRTVSTLPGLVCQSSQWWHLLPLSLACILVYTIGVLALILWVGWRAPRLSCDPAWRGSFFALFDFMLGNFRAGCWWWACVQTLYGLVINLATALIGNHSAQLKVMIIATLLYTSHSAYFSPYRFDMANIMEVVVQYAVILLMICGLSLVPRLPGQRYEELVEDENERAIFEWCIYAFFLAPFVTCIVCVSKYGWAQSHAVDSARHDLVFLHRLRDVMHVLGHHRVQELHALLHSMADYDVVALKRAMNVVIAQSLKLQPSAKLRKQQLILDCPVYAVATEELLVARVSEFVTARPMDRGADLRTRKLLWRFTAAMEEAVGKKLPERAGARLNEFEAWFDRFDLDAAASFSCAEFVHGVQNLTGEWLQEEEIQQLYGVFDINGDERVSRVEFLAALEHAMGKMDPEEWGGDPGEEATLDRAVPLTRSREVTRQSGRRPTRPSGAAANEEHPGCREECAIDVGLGDGLGSPMGGSLGHWEARTMKSVSL